jgi:uncharacterized protein (TIGR00251 family)
VAIVAVHVTPKAGRDEIAGWRGSELSVRVSAAPDGGKANAAVCLVLARALGVPKSTVRVVRGQASRHKAVEVDAVSAEDLAAVLGQPDVPLF